MAVIETWIKTDLKSIVKVTPIHGILFTQDNMANLIGVELLEGGQPATVTGSVSANVLRADGTTVAVSGTLSGNKASVTLPQAAYAVPGMLAVVIKLTDSSTVTTIGAIQAIVYRASTDTIIDPGTIIPSVQDLIAAIDAAVDSIPPDYSALTAEVGDLKNAFNNVDTQYVYENGYINCSGSTADPTAITQSTNYKHVVADCAEGDVFLVNGTGALSARVWCFIDSNNNVLAVQKNDGVFTEVNQIEVAPYGAAKVISNYRVDRTSRPLFFKLTSNQHLSLTTNGASDLVSGVDANNYTTPGSYYARTVAIAQSISHWPSTVAGRLIVMQTANPNQWLQCVIDTNSYVFMRVKAGTNNWGDWLELSVKAVDTDFTRATSIPSDSDLNDYTSPGNYYVATVAIANTIANMPVFSNGAKYGGRLTVMTINSASSIMQTYVAASNTSYIAWRKKDNTGWSDWYLSVHYNQIKTLSDALTPVLSAKVTNYAYATSIPEDSDLNDYTSPGNYYVATVAIANTIANMPSDMAGNKYGGRLTVETINSTAGIMQTYDGGTNTSYRAWRKKNNVGWSNWFIYAPLSTVESRIETAVADNAAYDEVKSKGIYNSILALMQSVPYNIAFANTPIYLPLKNYIGNTQNVHPKVLYFENGFGGHKYWMAYTPYPYSNDTLENPCVAYSDDGYKWTNIDANPLSESSGAGDYNSDTHLVYRSDTGVMECWYRRVGPSTQSPRSEVLYRRTTTDGITWTAEEQVFYNAGSGTFGYALLLSPAIIWDGSKYCMWTIANTTRIDYYESAGNTLTWTLVRSWITKPMESADIRFNEPDDTNVYPWHLDVIKDGNTYVMLIMCRNATNISTAQCSLFMITSSDNITYSTPARVIGGSSIGWDKYLYRSSIVKIGSTYRIYYSAGSGGTSTIYNAAVWGLGISESDSLTSGYVGKLI